MYRLEEGVGKVAKFVYKWEGIWCSSNVFSSDYQTYPVLNHLSIQINPAYYRIIQHTTSHVPVAVVLVAVLAVVSGIVVVHIV